MRAKFIIYFSILGCFLFGCATFHNPKSEYEDFMPLSIGNKWLYGSKFGGDNDKLKYRSIMEVIAIDTIHSKKYFKIKISYLGKDSLSHYYHHKRFSSDTLFSLFYYEKTNEYIERVDAIFSKDLGDTVVVFPFDKLCRGEIRVTKKTENTIEIIYYATCATDEVHWVTYKKGIGIVLKRSAWPMPSKLIDYSIN